MWAATSVLVDKLDKVPMAALAADFAALGLSTEVVSLLADRLQVLWRLHRQIYSLVHIVVLLTLLC